MLLLNARSFFVYSAVVLLVFFAGVVHAQTFKGTAGFVESSTGARGAEANVGGSASNSTPPQGTGAKSATGETGASKCPAGSSCYEEKRTAKEDGVKVIKSVTCKKSKDPAVQKKCKENEEKLKAQKRTCVVKDGDPNKCREFKVGVVTEKTCKIDTAGKLENCKDPKETTYECPTFAQTNSAYKRYTDEACVTRQESGDGTSGGAARSTPTPEDLAKGDASTANKKKEDAEPAKWQDYLKQWFGIPSATAAPAADDAAAGAGEATSGAPGTNVGDLLPSVPGTIVQNPGEPITGVPSGFRSPATGSAAAPPPAFDPGESIASRPALADQLFGAGVQPTPAANTIQPSTFNDVATGENGGALAFSPDAQSSPGLTAPAGTATTDLTPQQFAQLQPTRPDIVTDISNRNFAQAAFKLGVQNTINGAQAVADAFDEGGIVSKVARGELPNVWQSAAQGDAIAAETGGPALPERNPLTDPDASPTERTEAVQAAISVNRENLREQLDSLLSAREAIAGSDANRRWNVPGLGNNLTKDEVLAYIDEGILDTYNSDFTQQLIAEQAQVDLDTYKQAVADAEAAVRAVQDTAAYEQAFNQSMFENYNGPMLLQEGLREQNDLYRDRVAEMQAQNDAMSFFDRNYGEAATTHDSNIREIARLEAAIANNERLGRFFAENETYGPQVADTLLGRTSNFDDPVAQREANKLLQTYASAYQAELENARYLDQQYNAEDRDPLLASGNQVEPNFGRTEAALDGLLGNSAMTPETKDALDFLVQRYGPDIAFNEDFLGATRQGISRAVNAAVESLRPETPTSFLESPTAFAQGMIARGVEGVANVGGALQYIPIVGAVNNFGPLTESQIVHAPIHSTLGQAVSDASAAPLGALEIATFVNPSRALVNAALGRGSTAVVDTSAGSAFSGRTFTAADFVDNVSDLPSGARALAESYARSANAQVANIADPVVRAAAAQRTFDDLARAASANDPAFAAAQAQVRAARGGVSASSVAKTGSVITPPAPVASTPTRAAAVGSGSVAPPPIPTTAPTAAAGTARQPYIVSGTPTTGVLPTNRSLTTTGAARGGVSASSVAKTGSIITPPAPVASTPTRAATVGSGGVATPPPIPTTAPTAAVGTARQPYIVSGTPTARVLPKNRPLTTTGAAAPTNYASLVSDPYTSVIGRALQDASAGNRFVDGVAAMLRNPAAVGDDATRLGKLVHNAIATTPPPLPVQSLSASRVVSSAADNGFTGYGDLVARINRGDFAAPSANAVNAGEGASLGERLAAIDNALQVPVVPAANTTPALREAPFNELLGRAPTSVPKNADPAVLFETLDAQFRTLSEAADTLTDVRLTVRNRISAVAVDNIGDAGRLAAVGDTAGAVSARVEEAIRRTVAGTPERAEVLARVAATNDDVRAIQEVFDRTRSGRLSTSDIAALESGVNNVARQLDVTPAVANSAPLPPTISAGAGDGLPRFLLRASSPNTSPSAAVRSAAPIVPVSSGPVTLLERLRAAFEAVSRSGGGASSFGALSFEDALKAFFNPRRAPEGLGAGGGGAAVRVSVPEPSLTVNAKVPSIAELKDLALAGTDDFLGVPIQVKRSPQRGPVVIDEARIPEMAIPAKDGSGVRQGAIDVAYGFQEYVNSPLVFVPDEVVNSVQRLDALTDSLGSLGLDRVYAATTMRISKSSSLATLAQGIPSDVGKALASRVAAPGRRAYNYLPHGVEDAINGISREGIVLHNQKVAHIGLDWMEGRISNANAIARLNALPAASDITVTAQQVSRQITGKKNLPVPDHPAEITAFAAIAEQIPVVVPSRPNPEFLRNIAAGLREDIQAANTLQGDFTRQAIALNRVLPTEQSSITVRAPKDTYEVRNIQSRISNLLREGGLSKGVEGIVETTKKTLDDLYVLYDRQDASILRLVQELEEIVPQNVSIIEDLGVAAYKAGAFNTAPPANAGPLQGAGAEVAKVPTIARQIANNKHTFDKHFASSGISREALAEKIENTVAEAPEYYSPGSDGLQHIYYNPGDGMVVVYDMRAGAEGGTAFINNQPPLKGVAGGAQRNAVAQSIVARDGDNMLASGAWPRVATQSGLKNYIAASIAKGDTVALPDGRKLFVDARRNVVVEYHPGNIEASQAYSFSNNAAREAGVAALQEGRAVAPQVTQSTTRVASTGGGSGFSQLPGKIGGDVTLAPFDELGPRGGGGISLQEALRRAEADPLPAGADTAPAPIVQGAEIDDLPRILQTTDRNATTPLRTSDEGGLIDRLRAISDGGVVPAFEDDIVDLLVRQHGLVDDLQFSVRRAAAELDPASPAAQTLRTLQKEASDLSGELNKRIFGNDGALSTSVLNARVEDLAARMRQALGQEAVSSFSDEAVSALTSERAILEELRDEISALEAGDVFASPVDRGLARNARFTAEDALWHIDDALQGQSAKTIGELQQIIERTYADVNRMRNALMRSEFTGTDVSLGLNEALVAALRSDAAVAPAPTPTVFSRAPSRALPALVDGNGGIVPPGTNTGDIAFGGAPNGRGAFSGVSANEQSWWGLPAQVAVWTAALISPASIEVIDTSSDFTRTEVSDVTDAPVLAEARLRLAQYRGTLEERRIAALDTTSGSSSYTGSTARSTRASGANTSAGRGGTSGGAKTNVSGGTYTGPTAAGSNVGLGAGSGTATAAGGSGFGGGSGGVGGGGGATTNIAGLGGGGSSVGGGAGGATPINGVRGPIAPTGGGSAGGGVSAPSPIQIGTVATQQPVPTTLRATNTAQNIFDPKDDSFTLARTTGEQSTDGKGYLSCTRRSNTIYNIEWSCADGAYSSGNGFSTNQALQGQRQVFLNNSTSPTLTCIDDSGNAVETYSCSTTSASGSQYAELQGAVSSFLGI